MGGFALILLDTHVLIWLDQDHRDLGTEARQQIQAAYQVDSVYVSAISFWEVAMLADKERIVMRHSPLAWREDILKSGVREVPVTGELGIRAVGLSNLHSDPADRIVVATATEIGATLVTADQRLLEWPLSMPRLDARL